MIHEPFSNSSELALSQYMIGTEMAFVKVVAIGENH